MIAEAVALYYILKHMGGGGGHTEPSTPTKPSSPTGPSKPAAKTDVKLPPGKPAAPKPWPASLPADLPRYPDGWEPYIPPSPAVVARAKELLPELWKSGKTGTTKVEQTEGVWVTYVTFAPQKGMKGVAAYRPKAGSPAAEPIASSSKSTAIVPASTHTSPSKKKGKKHSSAHA